jgi:small ubiquitin-related modifier
MPSWLKAEEPVARPFRFAGGERGLVVAAMAPAVAANPIVKPATLVTLKVQDTQRRVVSRTMRRTDKLQVLMDCYYDVVCSAGAGARAAGRFVFDGKRLKGEQTPKDLGMKSGDQIDFFGDLGATTDGGDAEEEEVVDRKPVIKQVMDVTVKVQDTAGRTVKFTDVRTTQKLQVLMNAYYARVPDVTKGTGKFLYDGRQLKGEQTPAEIKMEGEDEILIDFFIDMMGGGGGWAAAAAAAAGQPPVPA